MRITDDRFNANSIGFLRLTFATFVVLTHCYIAGIGSEPLHELKLWLSPTFIASLGGLGVLGFFFFSGLLLSRSWETTPSLPRYLWHRFLRIFPGYWGCLLATAFVICPCVYACQHGGITGYFSSAPDSPFGYFKSNYNLTPKQHGIADLFASNFQPIVVNGSLWTLRIEFVCYLLLAGFGLLVRRKYAPLVLLGLFGLFLHGAIFPAKLAGWAVAEPAMKYLAPFPPERYCVAFFLVGMMAYRFRLRLVLNPWLALGAAAATTISIGCGVAPFVLPITYSYLLVWLAFSLPIQTPGRHIDLSFGIYLYGWPVQQTLIWAGAGQLGFWGLFGAAMLCTIPMAAMSWFLIERPALRLRHLQLLPNLGWLRDWYLLHLRTLIRLNILEKMKSPNTQTTKQP